MLRLLLGGLLAIAAQISAKAEEPSPIPPDPEIHRILQQRIDIEKQSLGIVVGVIDANGRRIVAHGRFGADDARAVDGYTIFEIGSVTKVFTALALAEMATQGEVSLDDPVAKYLPAGVTMPERGGRKITLRDLATHMSGLPRLPDNFAPKDVGDPYADYTVDQLYGFLSGYTLTRDIGSKFEYSNLGYGLLGHVLAQHTGADYASLIRDRIATPLGLQNTVVSLSPVQQARQTPGHDQALDKAPNWHMPTLPGLGALNSSANDMLTVLKAAMDGQSSPLTPAFRLALSERQAIGGGEDTGLGWFIAKAGQDEMIWHNGGTGGYRSFIGFLAKAKVGVVVLSNTSTELGIDDIGRHLLNPKSKLAEAPKVRVAAAVDPALYDRYIGRYQLAPDFILTVTRDNDRLYVQATGQERFEIFPENERNFFLKVLNAQISFDANGDGKATRLVLHQNGASSPAKRID